MLILIILIIINKICFNLVKDSNTRRHEFKKEIIYILYEIILLFFCMFSVPPSPIGLSVGQLVMIIAFTVIGLGKIKYYKTSAANLMKGFRS